MDIFLEKQRNLRRISRKEAKIEIAKAMKARGMEISLIIETTGLNLDEIEKL